MPDNGNAVPSVPTLQAGAALQAAYPGRLTNVVLDTEWQLLPQIATKAQREMLIHTGLKRACILRGLYSATGTNTTAARTDFP